MGDSSAFVLPVTQLPPMTRDDFEFFQAAIGRLAGISMPASKAGLISTRLSAYLVKRGFATYTDYADFLRARPGGDPEWQEFVNQLTTNKTEFFREPAHFDLIQNEIIPQWLRKNEDVFNVWSAASSTGEEPYTLAMALLKALPDPDRYRILATDIDTKVLRAAANGVYPRAKLSEIPEHYHDLLQCGRGSIADWMRVDSGLRDRLTFARHNLTEGPPPQERAFDLILCRNVMIYFSPATIEFVLEKLYRAAKPGARLLIGHSESLQNVKTRWKYVAPSIYVY